MSDWTFEDDQNLFTGGSRVASIDSFLNGQDLESEYYRSVQDLLKVKGQRLSAMHLPLDAGTRVAFKGDFDAVMTYDRPPMKGESGVVVVVKTGNGTETSTEGLVHVHWDQSGLKSIYPQHLIYQGSSNRLRNGSPVRVTVASHVNLSSVFDSRDRSSELIHRSTQDLWQLKREGDTVILDRLFDGEGQPLKGV